MFCFFRQIGYGAFAHGIIHWLALRLCFFLSKHPVFFCGEGYNVAQVLCPHPDVVTLDGYDGRLPVTDEARARNVRDVETVDHGRRKAALQKGKYGGGDFNQGFASRRLRFLQIPPAVHRRGWNGFRMNHKLAVLPRNVGMCFAAIDREETRSDSRSGVSRGRGSILGSQGLLVHLPGRPMEGT